MRALRRAWAAVSEPRHVTAIYFVGYLIIAALALWALTEPPMSVLGELGPLITASIAILVLVGAVIAACAALPGWWALERIGLGFVSLGLFGYIVTVVWMHVSSEGSRAMQLAGLSVGVVFVAARVAQVWGRDWAPRGARVT